MTLKGTRSAYRDRELKSIRARWDARAVSWDEEVGSPASHLNIDDAYSGFVEYLGELLARLDRPQTLDLGCGTGLVAKDVSEACRTLVGLDLSVRMIELAKARRGASALLVGGDAFELPFAHASFDLVYSRGILLSHYGAPNAPAFLAEVHRVLVPGGSTVLDYLNSDTTAVHYHAEGKQPFDEQEIAQLASAAGFGVLHHGNALTARVRCFTLVKH